MKIFQCLLLAVCFTIAFTINSSDLESKIGNGKETISLTTKELSKDLGKTLIPQKQPNLLETGSFTNFVTMHKPLLIKGNISCNNLFVNNFKVSKEVKIEQKLLVKNLKITKDITASALKVSNIESSQGIINIKGDLTVDNNFGGENAKVQASSFVVEGVKQWALASHDDFEDEHSLEGWSDNKTSQCGQGSKFLGGHCNFSFHEVSKVYKNLPSHSHLRVTAVFHMLDSWDGELAFMKINQRVVWSKEGFSSPTNGINICGSHFNDPAFAIPIDVIIPNDTNQVKITFGTTLDEEPCNESFGVDDVMIYVK